MAPPVALRSRPPLSSLLPAVDAFALVLAWGVSRFDPLALGLAALTFVLTAPTLLVAFL